MLRLTRGLFKSKPILYNYKATNKTIGSFVMYNPTNYKLQSRMISNYKNPTIFNSKLNNVINISACTFLAGSLAILPVQLVK